MKKSVLFSLLLVLLLTVAASQPGLAQNVGIGTTTPNAKAALEISATDKGLLVPRLTAAQRTAIASPPDGLMVFQTDGTAGFWYYFGGAWLNIPNAATAGDNLGNHTATQNLNLGTNQLVGNGGSSGLSISNSGQVGLGTPTPAARLDLAAGADSDGAGDPGGVAFQYRAGGFRHWLRSRHNSGLGSGNALDFYLNNASTAAGSAAAGTGSIQALTLENFGGQPRVGIGTPTPATTLDVNGTTRTSALQLTTGAANGRVLTSDASGNAIWTAPAATGLTNVSAPLTGNGAGTALSIPAATSGQNGFLTSTDWTTFNNKGSFSLPAFTSGSLPFSNGTTLAQNNARLFWDNTNFRLGVGTNLPSTALDVVGTTRTSALQVTTGAASGRVLTSDAGGNATWVAPAATGLTNVSAPLTGNGVGTALNMPAATSGQNGYLTSTDWTTFNSKGTFTLPALTTGSVVFSNGTTLAQNNAQFFWDNPNARLGLNTTAPAARLDVAAGADNDGAGDPGGVAFQYRTGGFRHWLRSRHNFITSAGGNALDFYLNNASTNPGSAAAGTGSIQALTLENFGGQPRVGVGTTAPATTLDVVGTTRTSALNVSGTTQTSALQVTTGAASGRVLTSDASGNATWQPSAATTASNGLNTTGTDVQLGGSLTQATTVAQGTNPLGFTGTGGVGIGTATPATSAQLEVASTTKGFLPPRLSQTQRDAIAAPATGLTLYNTTTGKLNTWNGTAWDAAISATEQPFQGAAVTFNFTGGVQTYTVPAGVYSLSVDARGAQGGTVAIATNNVGGNGARVQATLAVIPGQVLRVQVGGAGGWAAGGFGVAGGYNGGGGVTTGGAGGGATDLRMESGTLADRLLVAGGGGGGGYLLGATQGGGGGAPTGGNGTGGNLPGFLGTGASQTAGGNAGGGLGTGGNGGNGGAGGGGYYGGGGNGGGGSGAGGGGSSWVIPTGSTGIVFTAGANAGNGSLTITPGPAYAAPALDGSNISGTWSVAGNNLYRSTGNVGIGTNDPAARLDIQGGANADGSGDPRALAFQYRTGGFRHWVRSRHNDITSAGGNGLDFFVNNATTAAGSSAPGTGNVQVLTLENNAGQPRVGIGTTDPIARLHVNGGPLAAPVGTTYTFFNQTTPALVQAGGAAAGRPLAAYFTGGQVWVNDAIVAGAMQTTSDARIKRVVGLSDRTADLALLNRLRITDYRYIDQISNSNQVVKKIIAQEVEEVLPAAVSRSTQALPDVYERATAVRYADGQVTVTMAKAHGLPAAGGRMRFYTPTNVALDPAVTVVDAHTVRFASAESHAAGLFVYGKYVDDFRSVDYDALTTLNVSATQELARRVAALETHNATLQTHNTALQTQLRQQADRTEATTRSFEQRLRALEASGGQARR